MKPAVLTIAISLFLGSCGQLDSPENNAAETVVTSTTTFPVQPMQVFHSADLRLSYIGKTTTDSSIFYQVTATYEGRAIGFNLSLPLKEQGTAYFSTRGQMSDDFLHALQRVYGLPVDSTTHFKEYLPMDYLVGPQNKLSVRNAGDSMVPELNLNINEKEHWVELIEKDSVNRAPLVRYLTQAYGK